MVAKSVIVELADIGDAEEILALQKLAYQSEAALVGDYSIPPLTQTLEDLQGCFGEWTILKIVQGRRIVGSVRGMVQDGTGHIGRLIVHPSYQRRGLGTRLMQEIESRLRVATRLELFTGEKSKGNIRLYERLGYRIFRRKKESDRLTLVYMEKDTIIDFSLI